MVHVDPQKVPQVLILSQGDQSWLIFKHVSSIYWVLVLKDEVIDDFFRIVLKMSLGFLIRKWEHGFCGCFALKTQKYQEAEDKFVFFLPILGLELPRMTQ